MAEHRVINETLGRKTHGNPIIQPVGSVSVGKNWETVRDNVYRKPRGRELYGSGLPSEDINQFLEYVDRLIVHMSGGGLYYDSDGAGAFTAYTGSYTEPESGFLINSVEQNGNFYFTEDTGIKKIDALTSDPIEAGVDQGLDFDLRIVTGTWLDTAKGVAYRHVWSYFDVNGNKVIGAPSERQTVENVSGSVKAVSLHITIPDNITASYFLEIYRSSIVASGTVPPEDLQLVYQAKPTEAEISDKYLSVTDSLPDGFRGTELYTNTTQQGIENANAKPPKANSITEYKNHVFYGNVESLQRLNFNLISVASLSAGVSTLTLDDGTNVLELGCVDDVADATVASVADNLGLAEITTAGAHGYTTGDYVRFLDVTGTGGFPEAVNELVFEVTVTAGTTFTFGLAWDGGYTATGGTVDFYEDIGSTPRFVIHSGGASTAVDVDLTARSIVRTINQSSTNTFWYGYYVSGFDDIVGKMLITSRDVGSDEFYLYVDTSTTGSQFSPPITQSSTVSGCADNGAGLIRVTTGAVHGLATGDTVLISGVVGTTEANGSWTVTQVDTTNFDLVGSAFANAYISDGDVYPKDYRASNDNFQNAIMWSKQNESEHVPIINIQKIGEATDPVLRVVGLKDSLFIIKKKDGIYRLTGESATSFSIDEFDGTVECTQTQTISKGQNSIFMNTTMGYIKVSDVGVEVVGRDNEFKDLLPSFSTNFSEDGYGWFYEEEKSYFVANHAAQLSTSNDTILVYNTFTNSWMQREHGIYTNDDNVKLGLVVGGRIYYAPTSSQQITRERKTYTTSDFRTADITNTITAIDTDEKEITLGAAVTIPENSTLQQGDLTFRVVEIISTSVIKVLSVANLSTNISVGVSDCADNGSGKIRVTTSLAHGLVTDNSVTIAGVIGTTEANGNWVITVIDTTNFDLNNSAFAVAYVSGGTVTNAITMRLGIESTIKYQPVYCGTPDYEKNFTRLIAFFDIDETRVGNMEIKTSTDLDTDQVTTNLYETISGWGLDPWGQFWGTPTTTDRLSTYIPEEHNRGSYLIVEFVHRRPDEQCALCGFSITFENVSQRLDT